MKMDVISFGGALLETRDLDPVYCGLVEARLDPETLSRWLVAYWCLYHCGAASWLSEQPDRKFWGWLEIAATNEEAAPTGGRWPRGAERRHWRGLQAINSAWHLRKRYSGAGAMVEGILYPRGGPEERTAKTVMERAQTHVGFGPWIAFKIADMLDRVWGEPVDFNEAAVFMFKDPAKAADMLWQSYGNEIPVGTTGHRSTVVKMLESAFRNYKAPPLYDRPVNIQEVETVLCKWKSHQNGRYPVGKDIREIRHGLEEWARHSHTAEALLGALPEVP